MTTAKELHGLVATNRRQAIDLAQRMGRARLQATLQRAQASLVQRIHQAEGLKGAGSGSFTAVQLRATLRQIQDVLKTTTKDMGALVVSQARAASDVATAQLVDYLQRADRHYRGVGEARLPLKEAGVLDQVRQGVESTVLRRLAMSGEDVPGALPEGHKAKMGVLQRYGVETIGMFEEQLQQGILTRKPWAEVRDSLVEASPFLQGQPAYWAERIVRTETMGAYNRAGWEATRVADAELGDMVKILSATFDDRTGWDSYQVHGQIRRTQEAFEWRDGKYQHPPNRPNDREVVVPHRISWPLPEYLTPKSDGEVQARYREQRKSGSPGGRPRMTTVPRERFGKG